MIGFLTLALAFSTSADGDLDPRSASEAGSGMRIPMVILYGSDRRWSNPIGGSSLPVQRTATSCWPAIKGMVHLLTGSVTGVREHESVGDHGGD